MPNIKIKGFENDDGTFMAKTSGVFLEDGTKPGAVKLVPREVVAVPDDHEILDPDSPSNCHIEITMEEPTRPLNYASQVEAEEAKAQHAKGKPAKKKTKKKATRKPVAKCIFHDTNTVTWSGMYEEDGQIINTEEMPGPIVQHILDENKRQMSESRPRGDGMIGARIPITLHLNFRREWAAGPKKWGVTWAKFIKRKLNSPEYSYLRFMKL